MGRGPPAGGGSPTASRRGPTRLTAARRVREVQKWSFCICIFVFYNVYFLVTLLHTIIHTAARYAYRIGYLANTIWPGIEIPRRPKSYRPDSRIVRTHRHVVLDTNIIIVQP